MSLIQGMPLCVRHDGNRDKSESAINTLSDIQPDTSKPHTVTYPAGQPPDKYVPSPQIVRHTFETRVPVLCR